MVQAKTSNRLIGSYLGTHNKKPSPLRAANAYSDNCRERARPEQRANSLFQLPERPTFKYIERSDP